VTDALAVVPLETAARDAFEERGFERVRQAACTPGS
jgi:hypothetical protein